MSVRQSVGVAYWPHVRERLGEREEGKGKEGRKGPRDRARPTGMRIFIRGGFWLFAFLAVVMVAVVVVMAVLSLSSG